MDEAGDTDRVTAGEATAETPRWVKVFAIVAFVVVVLVVVVLATGLGGGHGPGRHAAPDSGGATAFVRAQP